MSAGAIGSSITLLQAPQIRQLAKEKKLPIGQRLATNLASPLYGFCKNIVQTRPSVQIAHYFVPNNTTEGFVLESWYNPPGGDAVTMPGYLGTHFARMQQYASTITLSPLVTTQARAAITRKLDTIDIAFPLGEFELQRLRSGIALLAHTLIDSGSIDFALASFGIGRELRTHADVDLFVKECSDIDRLHVGTAHPHGGNAQSNDPKLGVIDDHFRVRGITNLRICDASIFPDGAGVNPQWTVMALAHLCAETIA